MLIIRKLKNDARGRRDAKHCVSTAIEINNYKIDLQSILRDFS